jgi:PKD repeat protein
MNAYTMVRRSCGLLVLAILGTGCSVDKSSAPDVSAPSGFGLSVASTASPDSLPRDGQATSLVQLFVRDYQDKGVAGQRFSLSASTGTLSATDVTTDSTGAAAVRFTAPSANTNVTAATIAMTPISSPGTATSGTRTVVIGLTGPSVPVASFTWTPPSPGRLDLVTFDATNTTIDGASCLDRCTYAWDFGDATTSADRITTHRFDNPATYSVRLTVSTSAGVSVTSTRSVVVGAAAVITPVITQSPTDPKVGDVVIFDASSSTTPDGIAIVSYAWDFGNGVTASTRQASTPFAAARTYTVRLTIVDALGRTATTTRSVTVAATT